jgi:hypothetical protein
MPRLLTALITLIVLGCGGQPSGTADESDIVPMGEAHVELSDVELADLKQIAESGDLAATNTLVDYYYINHGDLNEDGIYWELQAARRGDCERWADLMFMVVDDGDPLPARFFSEGETLQSIGEASGCPPYIPRKKR